MPGYVSVIKKSSADYELGGRFLAYIDYGKRKIGKHLMMLADFGDPDEIRTRVTAVKGRCLRPLDHRAAGGCNWI